MECVNEDLVDVEVEAADFNDVINDSFLFKYVRCTVHCSEVGGELKFEPHHWVCDVVDGCALFGELSFLLEFVGEVEVPFGFGFVPEFEGCESDSTDAWG